LTGPAEAAVITTAGLERKPSAGTDKLTVTFTLRAATHADAIRSAGLAAGTLAEILTDNAAAVETSRASRSSPALSK
jgi:hypothetical protein